MSLGIAASDAMLSFVQGRSLYRHVLTRQFNVGVLQCLRLRRPNRVFYCPYDDTDSAG